MQEFTQKCYRFNIAANKDNVPTKKQLIEQLDLIKSELEETYDAVHKRDLVAIIDGFADISVTLMGLQQQLEALGFDTSTALLNTADNNLTKFIDMNDIDKVNASIEMYQERGVAVKADFNVAYGCYCLKNSNNKVMKPIGFVANDLSNCLPKDSFYKLL